jgi:hypothetical protein
MGASLELFAAKFAKIPQRIYIVIQKKVYFIEFWLEIVTKLKKTTLKFENHLFFMNSVVNGNNDITHNIYHRI